MSTQLKKLVSPSSGTGDKVYGVDWNGLVDLLEGNASGRITLKNPDVRDIDSTPIADRRIAVVDGLLRVRDTSDVEGRFISRLSLEQITDAEVAAAAAIAKSKISSSGRWALGDLPSSSTANRFLVVRTADADPVYDALLASDIPSLDASKITSGRFPLSRMPDAAGGFLKAQGAGVDPAYAAIVQADISDLPISSANIASQLDDKTLKSPRIRDIDSTPVGDVLLKVIDEVLYIRNSGDTADAKISGDAKARFASGLGAHAADHHSGGSDPLSLGSIAGSLTSSQHGLLTGFTAHNWGDIGGKPSVFESEYQKAGTAAGARPRLNFKDGSGISITLTDDAANDRVDATIAQVPDSVVQRLEFAKAGALTATRRRLNLIEGSGIALTLADDATNNEADLTVAQVENSVVQKTEVAKAGTLVGTRRRLNFIEGTNITLTITDDATNDEVDITIDAAAGGGGGAWTLIEEYTAAGNENTVTFTNIPQTYRSLVIIIHAECGDSDWMMLNFNNDTGPNYTSVEIKSDGSNLTTTRYANYTYGYLMRYSGAGWAAVFAVIPNYADTSIVRKVCISQFGNPMYASVGQFATTWHPASAAGISRIDIDQTCCSVFTAGSRFYLYGVS